MSGLPPEIKVLLSHIQDEMYILERRVGVFTWEDDDDLCLEAASWLDDIEKKAREISTNLRTK